MTFAAYSKSKKEKEDTEPIITEKQADPVILSLPVSDEMEQRYHDKHTLDGELTSYQPDVLDKPVPAARVEALATTAHEIVDCVKSTVRIERCHKCRESIGPCENCQERFNVEHFTTLEDLIAERDQYDQQQRNSESTDFYNDVISEEPLPVDFKPPEYTFNKQQSWNDSRAPYSIEGYNIEQYEQTVKRSEGDDVGIPIPKENDDSSAAAYIAELQQRINLLETQLRRFEKTKTHDSGNGANECMWHLGHFNTKPVGLPIYYDSLSDTFDSIGCFCSLQCAYAYRLEHRSAEAAPLDLLFQAYRRTKSAKKKPLLPAPPRQALKRFGGSMNLDQFLSGCNGWQQVLRSPFIPAKEFVTEIKNGSIGAETGEVLTTVAPAKDGLLRRRSKPHPNAANQWDSVIRRSKLRRGV